MFVGREKELAFLESKYTAENGQLIVLYGRRRVGKTETLKEFCKNKPHVFFACRECTDKLQLRTFSEKMLKEDIPARRYISQFENWEQAFRSVTDLPSGDMKKLLIIDEFPYMCRGNTSIPSVLQNLWDEVLKDKNLMIVLCGSSMSFIEKELLSEKNPLYGRATGVYRMTEMDFYDAVKFFPDYSDTDKVIAYSVLGGIPHYLKQFDPKKSLAENIKNNILTKGCVLYSEVDFLLRQELRETPIYNSLIEAIALGNTKLNEISQKSLVDDTSKTSTYLRNLIQLGIVEREFSVDAGTKKRANTNRGTYKLTDNFFRFWYAFVFTNYSELEVGDVDGVFHYSVEPQLHQFASMPFEDVCRQYVRKLQQANALPFRYAHMGRWTGKTTVRDTSAPGGTRIAETEIDILAVSKSRNEYLVCECKFKNKPFSYSEYLDTIAKLTPQKEKADFYYALFCESGFDNKIKEADNINKRLWLYELSDIVSGKTDFNG
ncbi:MAG: ATP-binding protein [Clostridia bacterium]|nr:ATP-binding protein [Clostridia bacterium]